MLPTECNVKFVDMTSPLSMLHLSLRQTAIKQCPQDEIFNKYMLSQTTLKCYYMHFVGRCQHTCMCECLRARVIIRVLVYYGPLTSHPFPQVLNLIRHSFGRRSALSGPGRYGRYSTVAGRTMVTSFAADDKSPYRAMSTTPSPARPT